jgi:hypothetical protein
MKTTFEWNKVLKNVCIFKELKKILGKAYYWSGKFGLSFPLSRKLLKKLVMLNDCHLKQTFKGLTFKIICNL